MMSDSYLIQSKQLLIGYRDKVLCSNLNISIPKGKLIGLFGRNGKGKTTLLKTLSGLIEPLEGDIFIKDKSINNYSQTELAKKIALVLTNHSADSGLYVSDVLKIGRIPYLGLGFKLSDEDNEIIDKAIESCRLESLLDRKFNALSDGEKQRVMLARAIVQDTEIILLDEPTAHLDVPNRLLLFELLLKLTQLGKTVIISTHEVELAKKYIHLEIEL